MSGLAETNAAAQGGSDANPGASTQDAQNSFDPNKFAADLEKRIAAQYSPEHLESLVQKHAHKGLDRLEKKVDGFQDVLGEFKALKAEGLTDAQAEERMRFNRMEAKINELSAPPPAQGKREDGMASELALGMLKGLGLSDTDPTVAQALIANANDPAGMTTSLVAIYEARKNQPPPSPASIGQQNSGASASKTDEQAVISEYETRLKAIPRGNVMAVSNLKAEYRKLAREKGFLLNI
jgi:hypothetical protein